MDPPEEEHDIPDGEPGRLLRFLQRSGEVLGVWVGFLLVLKLILSLFYLDNELPLRLMSACVHFLKPELFANCEATMYVWMLDEVVFWSIPLLLLWTYLLPRRIFLPFLVLWGITLGLLSLSCIV